MAKPRLVDRLRHSWALVLVILFALAVVILLTVLILTGRLETGFGEYIPSKQGTQRAKTFWDWLDLLLVPVLLAVGAALLNRAASEREHKTQLDRSRQAALQTYLDRVTVLLRTEWRESGKGFLEANIIRAQTLTALRQLDGERKGLLIEFPYESGLIGELVGKGEQRENAIVDLRGADLRGADLREVDLSRADLIGAYLSRANLNGADLNGADLGGAELVGAYLGGANLRGADLFGADLHWAKVTEKQLAQTKTLEGATLPDGTVQE